MVQLNCYKCELIILYKDIIDTVNDFEKATIFQVFNHV